MNVVVGGSSPESYVGNEGEATGEGVLWGSGTCLQRDRVLRARKVEDLQSL